MIKNEKYKVGGMSCSACQARVEKAVNKVPGVISCSVNLITNSMLVDREETTSAEEISKAVKDAGYTASIDKSEKISLKGDSKETKILIFRLVSSVILLIPLFYFAMGFMVNWPILGLENNLIILGIIELVLSLSIMVINHKFFINGTKAIFHGGPNMDTLVALGSFVAFIYSLILFVIMCVNFDNSNYLHHLAMNLSFETAGMVPTLITIGKMLESISKGRTTNAIRGLLELTPKTAHLIRDGKEETVDTDSLQVGDTILVKPGEYFPIDGMVIEGTSSVNESSLTGESMPVDKSVDSEVKSGTINLYGALTVKATKVGNETTINQIVKMVETASSTKTKISRIADRVSGIFVPVVIGISLIVFTFWMLLGEDFIVSHNIEQTRLSYSIAKAISVLVISCPCALGLATPVAIMVGNGKGAKNGILFKTAQVLEEAGKVNIVVLDKTGTITEGKPFVTNIVTNKGIDKNDLLKLAASIEAKSEHPLAKAIVENATANGIKSVDVSEFTSLPGFGASAVIDNKKIYGCSDTFLTKLGVFNPIKDEVDRYKNEGKTPLYFLSEDTVFGTIIVADKVKEDSKEAISSLTKMGVTPIMLTGDNSVTAKYIADEVGISHFVSDVLPDQKLDVIKKLQSLGKVMMVGDGINDALALTQADVGVAIGKGSDIAIDSADIVLTKSSLKDVYAAIRLSKKTLLNIKENLFWAFIYNIIMIPIAAGVFAPIGLDRLQPWMASAAMSISSICVVLNALRLNLINIYKHNNKEKVSDIVIDIDSTKNEGVNEMKVTLEVKGMMCVHCVKHVHDALMSVDGVSDADVSLEKGTAIVSLSKEVDVKSLIDAISNAGYTAKEAK